MNVVRLTAVNATTIKKTPYGGLIVYGLLALALSATAANGQATLAPPSFPPPPPTLAAMVGRADAVVHATVVSAGHPAAESNGRGGTYVRRETALKVIDVLKGDSSLQPNGIITVREGGGTVDVDGREISSPYYMQVMSQGDEVVLFLKRVNGPTATFDIAYGRDGAIWVDSNGHPRVPASLSRRIGDLNSNPPSSLSDLLARITIAAQVK